MHGFIFFAPSVLALTIASPAMLPGNLTHVGNSSNASASNLTTSPYTRCYPSVYGTNLNVQSCANAVEKIPRTPLLYVYGTRGQAGTEIIVPIRYQSDDGLCVIDLRPRKRGATLKNEITRPIDISDAAQRVIDQCIIASRSRSGGLTVGFSSNDQLAISVSKYESKASCALTQRTPAAASCYGLLQQMPSSFHPDEMLGPDSQPSQTSYCRLPKSWTHETPAGRDCEILVSRDPYSGSTMEKWADIWVAGVDIYTTCIRKGLAGSVYGLGNNGQIRIDISNDLRTNA